MHRVKKILDGTVSCIDLVTGFMGTAAGIGVFVLVFLVTNDVVMRYFFNRPTTWGFEISEYVMLFITFIGLCYTLLIDHHVKIDLLVKELSQRTQGYLTLFASVGGLLLSVVLTWKTGEATYKAYIFEWRSQTQLRLLMYPVYIIMPIGSALFCLAFFSKIYHTSLELLGMRSDAEEK